MDPGGSDGESAEDSSGDMELSGQDQDDDPGFLSLGVIEDREEPQETQPVVMSLTGDPGNTGYPRDPGDALDHARDAGAAAEAEAGAQFAPEQGPTAAEVREEADSDGDGDGVADSDGVGDGDGISVGDGGSDGDGDGDGVGGSDSGGGSGGGSGGDGGGNSDGDGVGDGDSDSDGDGVGEEADSDGAGEFPPPAQRQEGQEGPPSPEGPPPQATGACPLPAERQQAAQRIAFSRLQLRELEGLFQCTQYTNAFTRQELARFMDVPEARVQIAPITEIIKCLCEDFNGCPPQVQFKNRRTKWRRRQRALRFRNTPPVALVPPVVINLGGPCHAVLIPEPECV